MGGRGAGQEQDGGGGRRHDARAGDDATHAGHTVRRCARTGGRPGRRACCWSCWARSWARRHRPRRTPSSSVPTRPRAPCSTGCPTSSGSRSTSTCCRSPTGSTCSPRTAASSRPRRPPATRTCWSPSRTRSPQARSPWRGGWCPRTGTRSPGASRSPSVRPRRGRRPSRRSGAPRSVSVALSVSRWPAYTGLLLAVGLVWFLAFLLPPQLDGRAGVLRRMRRARPPGRRRLGGCLAGRAAPRRAVRARHRVRDPARGGDPRLAAAPGARRDGRDRGGARRRRAHPRRGRLGGGARVAGAGGPGRSLGRDGAPAPQRPRRRLPPRGGRDLARRARRPPHAAAGDLQPLGRGRPRRARLLDRRGVRARRPRARPGPCWPGSWSAAGGDSSSPATGGCWSPRWPSSRWPSASRRTTAVGSCRGTPARAGPWRGRSAPRRRSSSPSCS